MLSCRYFFLSIMRMFLHSGECWPLRPVLRPLRTRFIYLFIFSVPSTNLDGCAEGKQNPTKGKINGNGWQAHYSCLWRANERQIFGTTMLRTTYGKVSPSTCASSVVGALFSQMRRYSEREKEAQTVQPSSQDTCLTSSGTVSTPPRGSRATVSSSAERPS